MSLQLLRFCDGRLLHHSTKLQADVGFAVESSGLFLSVLMRGVSLFLYYYYYLYFCCLWPLPEPKAPRVVFPRRELWVKLKCRLSNLTLEASRCSFLVELIVFKGWTFAWPSLVDSFAQICKANRRSNRSSQPSELDEAGSPD